VAPFAGALLCYLVLAFLTFASAWRDPQRIVLGVGGDPLLSLWFLNWTPFALSHHLNPLFTNYVDSPGGANLMWNTPSPLLGILLWPVTASAGALVAYNLAETLGVALSAFAAFVAISHFVRHRWAASVGGLLYGFSPFMMAHALGHPQLTAAVTPPLMLVVLDDIVRRQQRPWWVDGALLGMLGACQLLLWEELLASEALVGCLCIALLCALYPASVGARRQHTIRALVGAAGVFGILASVPLGYQFLGPQQVHGSLWGLDAFVSDLLAFITPTPLQALAPSPALALSDLFAGKVYEWSSYLGIPLLVLLIYAAIRRWQAPLVRVTALAGTSVALLSMGALVNLAGRVLPVPVALFAFAFPPMARGTARPRLMVWAFLLAWGALALVPIVDNILPSRLTIFMYLAAAILLALFLDSELSRGLRPALIAVGFGALALVPLLPRFPYPATPDTTPPFFQSPQVQRIPQGSVALIAPFAYDWRLAEPMLWQVEAGMRFRMPEGFVWVPGPSHFPPHSAIGDAMAAVARQQPLPELTADRRAAMLADLRRLDVQTVIVASTAPADPQVELFRQLLSRPPSLTDGVSVWWDIDG
jgi:hypothetical protein